MLSNSSWFLFTALLCYVLEHMFGCRRRNQRGGACLEGDAGRFIPLLARFTVLSASLLLFSGCSISPFLIEKPTAFDPSSYDALHRMREAVPVEPLPPFVFERTPEVIQELAALQRSERYVERALLQRERYRELFTQIFRDEGVPVDLINLAIVESACNPLARSHAGAVGLWQFMRTTAQQYDLVVTKHRDDRTDVILSTIAAARHLRDLYREFSDWPLALAAYNAGVGGVRRAMIRAGADDFWTVARKKKLKKQTINYVPRIIAVSIVAADLDGNGLSRVRERLEVARMEQSKVQLQMQEGPHGTA